MTPDQMEKLAGEIDEALSVRVARLTIENSELRAALSEEKAKTAALERDLAFRYSLWEQESDNASELLKKLIAAEARAAKAEQERWRLEQERGEVNQALKAEMAATRAAEERAEALAAEIRWALGEGDDFPERPKGMGLYWWRTELRRRAALASPAQPRSAPSEGKSLQHALRDGDFVIGYSEGPLPAPAQPREPDPGLRPSLSDASQELLPKEGET